MFVNISENEHVLLMLYKKNRYSVSKFPGPALDLIPILPTLTCTFHQNTNRGLKKRIRVYFHIKYYHTLNPVRTFNQYHKKIFNMKQKYSLLTNLFNFTFCKLSFCKNVFNRACPPVYFHLCYFGVFYRKRN